LETVIQIIINSIASGLLLSLVSIGFTYIFKVTRVFHLAHGGIYVMGAFACWWMLTKSNNYFAAIIFAVTVVSMVIYLMEKVVYLPLNKKQSNQSISLIASMGFYIIIVNFLSLFFGNENKIIDNSISIPFQLGDIILTKILIIQIVTSILTIAFFYIYLTLSKSNLILKAVADNETISKVFGINTEKERIKVFIIGSTLASIAAILRTLEVGIDPQAGMSIVLTAAVVTILVSRLNILLIAVFSIALALLQNSIEWFLNAQWKEGITFLILLLVILFRTEGIISYNLRKDRA
jgi:branched-chain amino acid transport system permease protein